MPNNIPLRCLCLKSFSECAVQAQLSTSTGSIWPQWSPAMGEDFAMTHAGDGSKSIHITWMLCTVPTLHVSQS